MNGIELLLHVALSFQTSGQAPAPTTLRNPAPQRQPQTQQWIAKFYKNKNYVWASAVPAMYKELKIVAVLNRATKNYGIKATHHEIFRARIDPYIANQLCRSLKKLDQI